ncbi:glycoside hydrolase family 38 C-terminal domain-containing protein [Thermococcus sp. SY098]|uniref:alpha-mannosidase n=1 Tax=Thermococcus sp. SY098 TaxID=3111325 RepID=UPI002D786876|nr:glycoside hydrolase family 38 C-terminal domain-containing protein [Thermococcus sp. SY098]WRS52295.1 glycoside hydrolase family 38 C-terminal domain-containing protein [Thermococcus sp. SY098]
MKIKHLEAYKAKEMVVMKEKIIYFLPHTHWDREWYLPFQIFRARLLHVIDVLLEMLEKFPEFKFNLDGQVIALEDYLEIEKDPQKTETLFSMIRNGRVSVGPFYVLPDEFLISGETFIRNFLIAQRVLEELSLPSMKVAYLPDMFGHSAYVPTLIRGLGMDSVLIWRGVGDKCRDTEFIWRGPDGSEVLCINIIRGYWNLGVPPSDYHEFKRMVEKEVEFLFKHSPSGHILLMAGNDHRFPFPLLPDFVRKLNSEGLKCKIVTLDEYVQILQRMELSLKKIEGEMRDPKYAPILKDVASARIHLKQRSHLIEKELVSIVEPLSAIAYIYSLPLGSVLDLLFYAWKLFLKTLPHDDICGCSIDQVHKEMEVLQDQVLQLIKVIKLELVNKIAGTLVKNGTENGNLQLFVFSPFERKTKTVVEKELYMPEELPENLLERLVVMEKGKKLPTVVEYIQERVFDGIQALSNTFEEEYIARFLTEEAPPQLKKGKVVKIKFEAELPPMGFKTFNIEFDSGILRPKEISKNVIETAFLKVNVNEDGTLTIEDRRTGRMYRNLFFLEDAEDVGDEYNYSPSKNPEIITTLGQKAKIKRITEDSIGFSVEVEHELRLPQSFDFERERRSEKKVSMPVNITYIIYKRSPRVDIKIEFENIAKDHRLRVHIPLPVHVETNMSDDYFGIVTRPNKIEIPEDLSQYSEVPESRYPMQNFVYIADDTGGVAISTRGLKEYETIQKDGEVEVALTLLRSVGMLSRPGLLTRSEDAGPSFLTPEAQCLGNHIAEFSVWFTDKHDLIEAYNFSRRYQIFPPVFSIGGIRETEISLLSLEPECLILSSFKVSEDGDGTIIRFYNVKDMDVNATVKLGWVPKEVWLANMAEKPIKKIKTNGNIIKLKVGANEVITLKVV